MKMTKSKSIALMLALTIPSMGAIAKDSKMTALQIQQMQVKDVEVNKSIGHL